MIRKKLNIRGETLTETIIALSVLAIGVTIASTVILNSMRNLTNAKNRVIAVNIAREGIEAVRNIRDTNWLYYSDKRRQCWNHDPSVLGCDGTNPIPPGTYIVYKFLDESWHLRLADSTPGVNSDGVGGTEDDLDVAPLSLVDIANGFDSDGDGDTTNDMDFYNHMHADVTTPFGAVVRSTAFTRYIVIEYLENQPDNATAPSNASAPNDSISTLAEWNDVLIAPPIRDRINRMRVTSVVGWQRSGASHTAELKTIISDHLGRTNLGN